MLASSGRGAGEAPCSCVSACDLPVYDGPVRAEAAVAPLPSPDPGEVTLHDLTQDGTGVAVIWDHLTGTSLVPVAFLRKRS